MASNSQPFARSSTEEDLRALAQRLNGLGLANLAASLLESNGAFGVLGAQLLYLGQPLLAGFGADDEVNRVAADLEDPATIQTLITYLREDQA